MRRYEIPQRELGDRSDPFYEKKFY